MRTTIIRGSTALAVLVAVPLTGLAGEAMPKELADLKAAFEKYQDPYVAIRDGYFSTVGCMEFAKAGQLGAAKYPAGSMGIHFLNPAHVGPVVDVMKPQILLYEPGADGKLHLAGVEWFVPLATGIKERPVLLGHAFDGPMEGHEPLLPRELHHYDLHVWLWKPNPAGMFTATNPDVKCTGYPFTIAEETPHGVTHAE